MSKVKTLGDVISAIQDECGSDAETIAKLETLLRDRKLRYDRDLQSQDIVPAAGPRLQLVHSRPRIAGGGRPVGQLAHRGDGEYRQALPRVEELHLDKAVAAALV